MHFLVFITENKLSGRVFPFEECEFCSIGPKAMRNESDRVDWF